ncbi:MAG: peptidoglycan D,D-transpeptidase FtsI family protein, partial [Acidimicrobiales bacterium]
VTLAHSMPVKGSEFKYLRQYPTGPLFGQITGYYSFTYGADGVEKTYNSVLTGAKSEFKLNLNNLRSLLTNPSPAQSLTLTLTDKLQTLAQQQLAGRTGSVVAINPRTGGILAMYSNPSFDPSQLSQLDQTQVQAAWKSLLAAPGNPLSSGAYRNRFFPGSTFKVITASTVYDHQPSLVDKDYPVLSALSLPNTNLQLHNFANESCGGMLVELFTVSCDTGFAAVGLDLGAASLSAEASSFGFDATPPIDLPDPAQSNFPAASTFADDLPGVAYSAIGQQDVQATPLEMAMVAGAIANGGTMMVPHVLSKVTNSQGRVVSSYQPKVWMQATSSQTAQQMTTLMESVVNSPDGTGTAAQIPGIQVAGKTGTAQTGTGLTDDWFIAFAPANNPTIAAAVLLPDQPSANDYQGGTIAAPIAKAMIQSYLTPAPNASNGSGSTATTTSTTAPGTGTSGTTTSPTTFPTTSIGTGG